MRYQTLELKSLALTSTLPSRISSFVLAEVRPQIDGIIIERLFEEGQAVQKGQTLYRIDAAPYQAAYAAAKASLDVANVHATALALLEKRQRDLLPGQSISRQDLDNTILQHSQARVRVNKAQAELKNAAINLSCTEMKSPVSGHIGASASNVGALVTANQPSPRAVIRQIDRVLQICYNPARISSACTVPQANAGCSSAVKRQKFSCNSKTILLIPQLHRDKVKMVPTGYREKSYSRNSS